MVESGGLGLLLAQAVLNEAFGATAWGVPPTLYFALSTGRETDPMAEPTQGIGGYARAVLPNDLASWYLSTGSEPPAVKRNSRRIAWPRSTGAWSSANAPLRSFAILTAPTGVGALMARGPVYTLPPDDPPVVNAPGIELVIDPEDLELTVEAYSI